MAVDEASETIYKATRLGMVFPPAIFLFLMLVFLLGAPDLASRLFCLVMAVLVRTWLYRCLRAAVIISARGVMLRGQLRTSSYSWDAIEGAAVLRMSTASPLAGLFPYVNLALRLSGGRTRSFAEFAAPAKKRGPVDLLAGRIQDLAAAHRCHDESSPTGHASRTDL